MRVERGELSLTHAAAGRYVIGDALAHGVRPGRYRAESCAVEGADASLAFHLFRPA